MKTQQMPALTERAETGPMKFGDDWTGVFIRGDNALAYADLIALAAKHIPASEWLLLSQLSGLADDLRSCSEGDTGWPPRMVRP